MRLRAIFPEVNYSHIISIKKQSDYEMRRYRSHIERKSADFVICDKDNCIPLLVIDIDGEIHNRSDRKKKDKEIDDVLHSIGLPIIRFTNEQSRDKEFVKTRVLKMLD